MAARGRPRKDGVSGDETDIHIIMQLKSASNLSCKEIAFRNGDKKTIDDYEASQILDYYMGLMPAYKLEFQEKIGLSLKGYEEEKQNIGVK